MFKQINEKMECEEGKFNNNWIKIAGFFYNRDTSKSENKEPDVYLGKYYYPVNEDIKKKADELKKDIRFKFGTFTDDSKRLQFIDQFNRKNPKSNISYRDIWIELDEKGDNRIVDERGGACRNVTSSSKDKKTTYKYIQCRKQPSLESSCQSNNNEGNTGGKKYKSSKSKSKKSSKSKTKKSKTLKHKRKHN